MADGSGRNPPKAAVAKAMLVVGQLFRLVTGVETNADQCELASGDRSGQPSLQIGEFIALGGAIRLAARIDEVNQQPPSRSEEHTSELQSLMRISYAVFCLKQK